MSCTATTNHLQPINSPTDQQPACSLHTSLWRYPFLHDGTAQRSPACRSGRATKGCCTEPLHDFPVTAATDQTESEWFYSPGCRAQFHLEFMHLNDGYNNYSSPVGSRGGNFGAFDVQTPRLHYSCLMISAGINMGISNYSCDYYLIYSTKAPIWLFNTDLIRSTSRHLNFMMSKHTLIITFSLQRHDECHRPQAARLLVCWVWFMKELQHHAVNPATSPPRYYQSCICLYI